MKTTRRNFLRLLGIGAPAAALIGTIPTWRETAVRKLGGIRDWIAPRGTFSTYDMIGTKEDLMAAIYNVEPTDIPFRSVSSDEMAASMKADMEHSLLAGIEKQKVTQ